MRVLSESFSREPMSAALGVGAQVLTPLVERFMPECTTNELSVVATPADDPATVAGAFICRDYKAPLPGDLLADFPWFAPVAEVLGAVDAAYEAQRPGLAIGEAVDLWMVGVDRRFVKRGLASTLFRVAADIPRVKGFRRVVTECAGHFSQTAARKAGLQERARVAYRDFRFGGRAVFATIEPPHTHTILFEREF